MNYATASNSSGETDDRERNGVASTTAVSTPSLAPSNIFVDLDGTLVRTDLFIESMLKFVKRNPCNAIRILAWSLHGRPFVKERIAREVEIDTEFLPYDAIVIKYLRGERQAGRNLILATGTARSYAEEVAVHLDLFDKVIASDASTNLAGITKLAAIREIVGDADFAYVGNSAVDRPIWAAAAETGLVNAPAHDRKKALNEKKKTLIFNTTPGFFGTCVRELRLYQWIKNLLIFVPLFASHGYRDLPSVLSASLAFACFCLCASGVYVLNDLLDLDADRRHFSKRYRPLASGDLPVTAGILVSVMLPLLAFILAWSALPASFLGVLVFYFLLATAYSFFLKSLSTADVMTLAILYTLRIIAGAAALGVVLSSWLMAFSIFIFVSLAYLKRYVEVSSLESEADRAQGRGYLANDRETMFSLGTANMTASVLVLALYISSHEVSMLYRSPQILWLLCLLLLYWGNRIWIGARRGKVAGDPVIFALKDPVSQMVAVSFVLVTLAARYSAI